MSALDPQMARVRRETCTREIFTERELGSMNQESDQLLFC